LTRLLLTELPPSPPPEMPKSDVFRVYPIRLGLTTCSPSTVHSATNILTCMRMNSESLCGRLYPLPRSTTFHFCNALHLIEARNSVAYVRSIFQRLLALLGERELGCRYPITSWFGQLCHCFPPREHPRRLNGPGLFT